MQTYQNFVKFSNLERYLVKNILFASKSIRKKQKYGGYNTQVLQHQLCLHKN